MLSYLPFSIPQVASSAAPESDIMCSMLVTTGSRSGKVRKATRFPLYMVEAATMKNHQKQMRSLPESASGNMFPPEGGFIVIGQILPVVKLILGAMSISK